MSIEIALVKPIVDVLLAKLKKIKGIKVKKRASVELTKVIRSIVKIRSDGTVTGAKSKIAAKKAASKKPVAKKAPVKKPVAKKAPVKKPVAKKPVARKSVIAKAAAGKPVAKKPVTRKVPVKKPAVALSFTAASAPVTPDPVTSIAEKPAV